jgi:predicted GIY-YIG superfamily endonuclease
LLASFAVPDRASASRVEYAIKQLDPRAKRKLTPDHVAGLLR